MAVKEDVMSIITISRGSYSRGKEIAEKLAERLGYECISRDIILEASEHFNVPEVKLIRTIHDAPSILDRFTHGKEKYMAFIREAFLKHVQKDNIIYHGLAGHFFLTGVPHVMKVRIIANIEERVKEEMKRENITEEEALYILRKDDEERRKWSLHLYGIDTWRSSLYDVVLHINKLRVSDAVDILTDIVQRPCFQTTPESQQQLDDLVSGAEAKIKLLDKYPRASVECHDGILYVSVSAPLIQEKMIDKQITQILSNVNGIKEVRTNITPTNISASK
jgi:cytidylate kinase